ncbi:hypothetical protein [Nonomuraea sp. PA05]|uniref:hypothetical protein n=1 Tax=Nonomuraea sp. PA05 TaxID=2604466 RepID=UPI00165223EB|nr:hypothetical protein [Nonomuraea sp. PA05]
MQEADADVEAALHAAGVLLDRVLGPLRQADDLEDLVDPGAGVRAAQAVEAGEEAQAREAAACLRRADVNVPRRVGV